MRSGSYVDNGSVSGSVMSTRSFRGSLPSKGFYPIDEASARKEPRDGHAKTQQMRLGREFLEGVEHLRLCIRTEDGDSPKDGVDHPDNRDARFQVELDLFIEVALQV